MNEPLVLWWVKRDARLGDNSCLSAAAESGTNVLPFYCLEPSLRSAGDSSEMHVHAQWQAVTELRRSLRRHSADILIAHGEVIEKLSKLHASTPFTHLFCHEEVGNAITYQRDLAVAAWCREHGIQYREFPQSSVRRGGVNRDRLQAMWLSRIVNVTPLPVPVIRQQESLRALAASTSFPRLPFLRSAFPWQPVSEPAASETLDDFLRRRGICYRGGISSPNTAFEAGSRLSVHLAWGTITSRTVWHAVRRRLAELDPKDPSTKYWKPSLSAFLSRLHWRDHFTQRLESEPDLEFQSLHPAYRDVPYENDERLFAAWREGLTGYPLVDAVMRCLTETGFVNFRMRAMVVSFACHVLHLDWRLIHPFLASVFRDYDPGIHLSQLQMQAGVVGVNTIRVYNPMKQLTDWDTECHFVRRWVPELREAATERILNDDSLPGYPSRVVTFTDRARWMKQALYALRSSPEAKLATASVFEKHGSRKKNPASRRKSSRGKSRVQPPTLFDTAEFESTGQD